MANILDYLAWRGDLRFDQSPYCEVDALLFSRLPYMPWDGIVPADYAGGMALPDAARICQALVHDKSSGRRFRLDDDDPLLSALADCPRYASLKLCGFVSRFDEARQEQFSATTILLPEGSAVVAYRGTDGTIIGWKEDFNMGFADEVPAQLDAVDYLERAAAAMSGPLTVVGHSKGGNLAVYAAAFCRPETQARIVSVRSHDGPGFNESTVAKESFRSIMGRTRTFLPQSSVVGMLLEHEEDFTVVHSCNKGLLQHDVYSWDIVRDGFLTVEGVTNSSRFIDRTLKDWTRSMTAEQREKMIDGVFSILDASDGTTMHDLWNGKNTVAVLRAWANMDDETRALLKEAFNILKNSAKKSLTDMLQR